jgi:SAM-dependent methyltransferase
MADSAYDTVRYSNYPYAQTHPDRLATVAILHGLEPPDPFHARVLEIGCGAGGNLMAMAAATPGLEIVGVDLAAGPIADGRAALAEIGLKNAEMVQADVRALTDGRLGTFDYIVAHGVYGWIPPDANDALLATIARCLAPDGIAYVSFNTQPGGYFRRMLRDAGLWHARAEQGDAAKAHKAQELYKFLQEHRVTRADMYGSLLEREVPALAGAPLYRLVHDDLGEFWNPVWFGEFAEHAGRHGLGYIGEADLYSLRVEMLPDDVEPEVWKLAGGDRVAFETYSDLLTARHFRQCVIGRGERVAKRDPSPERTRRLHWAARVRTDPPADGLVADVYAALDAVRPRTLGFDELRERLQADAAALGEALLDGFRGEHLIPHAGPLRAALTPGERPSASPLARWQALRGPELTSLAYTTVRMEEPAARLLITLLDGTRDRAAIRAELRDRAGLDLTAEDLDRNLVELARLFLLEP